MKPAHPILIALTLTAPLALANGPGEPAITFSAGTPGTYSATITNQPLDRVLAEAAKQMGVSYAANPELLRGLRHARVTARFKNAKPIGILQSILVIHNVDHGVHNGVLVLVHRPAAALNELQVEKKRLQLEFDVRRLRRALKQLESKPKAKKKKGKKKKKKKKKGKAKKKAKKGKKKKKKSKLY